VHSRVFLSDGPDYVLGQDVPGMGGEGVNHGPPRPGHPLAPGMQHARDLDFHVRSLDEHLPSVPGARQPNGVLTQDSARVSGTTFVPRT